MRRVLVPFSIAMALLLTTAGLVAFPQDTRAVALRAPLESVPTAVQEWTVSPAVPPEALPADPRAGEQLHRTYVRGRETVWVSVGYYPRQVGRDRPTAQQLLYPGSGWADLTVDPVRLPLDGDAALTANFLMRTGGQPVGILYWYEIQGRSIASDHWYRALLLYNRVVHGRADGALVRIAAPATSETRAAALATLGDFVRAFHPQVVRSLPR